MNPFIESFCRTAPLSREAIALLEPLVKEATFPKNTILFSPDEEAPYLFYIYKGLFRIFSQWKGKEITQHFAQEEQFYGCSRSILLEEPSDSGVHLLESSSLYYLDSRAYEECCKNNRELANAGNQMLKLSYLKKEARLAGAQFMSAKERYRWLVANYPTLLNRVPLKYIASYLDVTPVSLSRIRSERY